MQYLELAKQAVKEARKVGANATEAYILDAKSLQVEVANENVETLKFSEDTGIGIRVISAEGRVGFAFSTNIEPNSIKTVIDQAIANSHNTFADRFNTLPLPHSTEFGMNLLDPAIAAAGVEEKIELAKRVEMAARRTQRCIKRTERCVYEDAEYGVALVNSNDLAIQYRSGYCGLYGVVLAEEDSDVQTGMALNFTRSYSELSPEDVGREAAEDAALLIGAKSIGTTRAALVLSPYVVTNFFSVLIPSLSADAVHKGRSLFKNKVGTKVASSLISLFDDGLMSGGIATAPIDGEGVSSQHTELIADGVLKGYLHNSYTALKDNVSSTGNGVRHSFKGMPEIGPTNIFISAGKTSRQQLLHEVKDGFYVTNVMGMHTANPISGDFSVGASGIWIKNGEFTQAVRGVAIAGNIVDLLSEVDAVGDDLRFFGSQGAPTIRISQITISGN
ncbi:MAG: peptidase modulator of gyrase [Firmicutes bacterium]|nr:peptidase modulator of gyrase [Bacillota bacterium]